MNQICPGLYVRLQHVPGRPGQPGQHRSGGETPGGDIVVNPPSVTFHTLKVRRLQHHASMALWAGNNENEAALRGNWYQTDALFDTYK